MLLESLVEGLSGGRAHEIRVGPFLTAVVLEDHRLWRGRSVARCGLASSLVFHEPRGGHAVRDAGRLEEKGAPELASYLLSEDSVEAAVGLATVNALLDVPDACLHQRPVLDLLLEHARGEKIAVVGHFPFVERLRGEVEELFVLELRPEEGDLPSFEARRVLPGCRVVVLTATVLLNGTYGELLPLCRDAFTIMMGPSTPPSPLLFDHGIDVLAGSLVVDPAATVRAVSQGATYRDLDGVRKWVWRK